LPERSHSAGSACALYVAESAEHFRRRSGWPRPAGTHTRPKGDLNLALGSATVGDPWSILWLVRTSYRAQGEHMSAYAWPMRLAIAAALLLAAFGGGWKWETLLR
jgi:hypothetical protein